MGIAYCYITVTSATSKDFVELGFSRGRRSSLFFENFCANKATPVLFKAFFQTIDFTVTTVTNYLLKSIKINPIKDSSFVTPFKKTTKKASCVTLVLQCVTKNKLFFL